MKKLLLFMFAFLCSVGMWADSWEKVTDYSNLDVNATYVIACDYQGNGTYYALKNTAITTNTNPTAHSITVSDDKITSTVTNDMKWKISVADATNGYYYIYSDANNDNYLQNANSTGSKITTKHSTDKNNQWEIHKVISGDNPVTGLYNVGQSRMLGVYNGTSGYDWRAYKSTNYSNIKNCVTALFKLVASAPTVAYTVTFNAGTNGTCSTTSLTEASAGAGVTLPSCTPNSGYGFLGWTATQDKTTIDAGLTAGSTYKPSASTTLYAVYAALYQVTIEEPTNGTLTVTCGGNDVTSGEYYAVGQNINIVATPSAGYKFRNIQVVDATTHTFTASNEKVWEMGAHDITIKANFDEIVYRTITWSVNGNTSTIAPTQVEDGTNITFPTGLADINGKKFMGWSANSSASTAGDLVSGNVAASADVTYYAVFADVTEGDDSEITLDYQNVHTAYTTDGNDRDMQNISGLKYYGCCQGKASGSNEYSILQMRKTSNDAVTSWIYNNAALNIKDVKITYMSTNNKLCNVYFGNTANPTTGLTSCDGTADAAGENTFTNTTGSTYFRIENPKNGAIYISSIVITCKNTEYSNYTTTIVPPTATINITTPEGYSTFVCEKAIVMPEGFMGAVAESNVGVLNWNWMYKEGDVVPANTPILVFGTETSAEAEITTGGTAPSTNYLVANTTASAAQASVLAPSAAKFYVLSYDKNGENLGFYWLTANGSSFDVPVGKVFLGIPATLPAPTRFLFGGEATSINAIENVKASTIVYNLNGQRVNANAKGIVIVNGKKVLK